ncbi:MAG: hypothetical protein LHV68_02940 [Elusimicrobia bacterium]|nr:hypothetical protein [Candidatus Liberimonas magnetica]
MFLGCIISVLLLILAVSLRSKISDAKLSEVYDIERDVDLTCGNCYKPNTSGHHIAKSGDRVLYDAVYSFDEYGRRATPAGNEGNRKNSILFFGCSFMFGHGLQNNETLPFYISELVASFKPYNYAVCGGGPHYMLAKLNQPGITEEVQKGGKKLLIYLFVEDHINRVSGKTIFGCDGPYFYLDSENKLRQKGLLSTARFWKYHTYKVLKTSPFGIYIEKYAARHIDQKDIELTFRVIEESKKTFKRKFKSDDFYVVIYPPGSPEIISYFKKSGIKYLVYENKSDFLSPKYAQPDGHPTAQANKGLAEMIFKDLKCLQE